MTFNYSKRKVFQRADGMKMKKNMSPKMVCISEN